MKITRLSTAQGRRMMASIRKIKQLTKEQAIELAASLDNEMIYLETQDVSDPKIMEQLEILSDEYELVEKYLRTFE